ncbi:MAG: PAS domain S-box protein, partial [Planctomycetota bacterium]
LAEQSPNMIFINKGGKVVYANKRCEEVMGYTREQLYSPDFDFLSLIAPESQDLIKENLARHVRGEELEPYDYSIIDKNGGRIEAINASRLIQYEGQTAILGIVTDITERKRAEKGLRESEQKFRSYIDNAPDGVIVVDRQGRYIEANEAICNMTGFSKDELLAQSVRDTLAPESQEAGLQHFNKAVAEGWATGEYAYLRKNGSAGYWTVDAVKISENRFLGFVKDVTDNKRAEEALRASEEKFRSIFDTAPNLITSVNEDGTVVDCNRRILEILGYQKEEVIGQSMAKIIHPDYLADAEKALQEVFTIGFSYNKEYRMVRKDGSLIDVSINSSAIKDESGRHVRTLCVIDNITDRKQAEQRILEDRAQLKSLASQLSLTEERERRRLATELHDQIGQSLVISKIKLDQLRESAASDELTNALQEVCHCLSRVIQDTRMLTFDLSSPILYELGFEAAVAEWLADEVRGKHGIQTEFEDDGQSKPLDEDIRALLFRNVRELLINIVKHAKAGKVKVSLQKVDEHINVIVEDDGVGFDPVEVKARAAKRAEFGLFSIRERLEQLGGHIEIESGPGHGSRISMIAPLKSEENS